VQRAVIIVLTGCFLLLLSGCSESDGDRIGGIEGQLTALQTRAAALESQLEQEHARVTELRSQIATLEDTEQEIFAVAYLDIERAFGVFTDEVSDLREIADTKQKEFISLQEQYQNEAISAEEYKDKNNQLLIEVLQAQIDIDMGTLDGMIASSGFSDVRGNLEQLREQAQTIIVDEVDRLEATIRVGVINPQEFESRYTQVQNAFTQLDQALTQIATTKIVEAAHRIAQSNGYDLVLQSKNVIIYGDARTITDITDLVRYEISLHF